MGSSKERMESHNKNTDENQRPYVNMIVVVHPDIASEIDEQVTNSIYFPYAFFKKLYPDYVRSDSSQNI